MTPDDHNVIKEEIEEEVEGRKSGNPRLRWLESIPVETFASEEYDVLKTQDVLNSHNYGMWDAKDLFLEHMASGELGPNKGLRSYLIIGARGVGKETFIRALAEAMGRPYVQIPLGLIQSPRDVHGEGVRRYGSTPGRIIQAIVDAGVMNPVVHIEDVHEMSRETLSALLEIVDPEQSRRFKDRFINCPVDISRALFILTSVTWAVPGFLTSRVHTVEAESFTSDEKVDIYKKYLLPDLVKETGIKSLKLTDAAVRKVIQDYTMEAGVSDLYRTLHNFCQKIALMEVRGQPVPKVVSAKFIRKVLGPPPYWEMPPMSSRVGCVNGLSWTNCGGGLLPIESVVIPGGGEVILTGTAGPVMRESSVVAWDYVKSICPALGISPEVFNQINIHINIPDISSPKDGPSASVGMVVSIISSLLGLKVTPKLAITGEMTLRGKIIPIGGLQEKLTSAVRAGIKTVIIPADNKADLEKLRGQVLSEIEVVLAKNIRQVINIALKGAFVSSSAPCKDDKPTQPSPSQE